MCRGKGITNVMLETDSILVADALNGSGRCENYASNFISATLDIAPSVHMVTFSHVGRKTNVVAHELARSALELDGDRSWKNDVP